MTITPLSLGSVANDGTGQDLRSGGQVINANFTELDQRTSAAQATADAAVTDTELATGLAAKVDKVTGKGLSTEDFTTGEKTKLAGLQPPNFRGTFTSLAALQAGVTAHFAGDYADVDAGVGSDVQRYIWDNNDNKWVIGSGGGGPASTDSLPEGTTNLYFTGARVLAVVLAGLSLVTGSAVVATDTVIVAIGKLQKQITDLTTAVSNKASKGVNGDITSLTALNVPLSVAQGGTGSTSGIADMVGASTTAAGTKGLVPAPGAGVTRFLSSLGTWITPSVSAAWGSITGTLSAQTDLQAALDAKRKSSVYSPNQTITFGSFLNWAHGLAAQPIALDVWLICVVADHGFTVGTRVKAATRVNISGSGEVGFQYSITATNATVWIPPAYGQIALSDGIAYAISATNWRIQIEVTPA